MLCHSHSHTVVPTLIWLLTRSHRLSDEANMFTLETSLTLMKELELLKMAEHQIIYFVDVVEIELNRKYN